MKPSDQILKSLSGSLKAFSVIAKLKLRWVYLLPTGIYLLIFVGGFSLSSQFYDEIMQFTENSMADWIEKYSFLEYITTASAIVSIILIKIGLFFLLGIISGYTTLILLSPVYAWISEKMHEEIMGVKFPFKFSKFIKDVARAIVIAVRNGLIQLAWTIVLFFLSFIPIINFITVPLLFIIPAYFYGFSFLDYSHERLDLNMKQSIREVRALKFSSVMLGGIFQLCFMIPWIGSFIASMLSFNLVISGTMLVLQKENNSEIRAI